MAKIKKFEDLQSWLDYFDMLREYVDAGLLQMEVGKHEAFVTQPALHAMSNGDDPVAQIRDGSLEQSARRLRTYAGWLSGGGEGYLQKPFAVHVVKPDVPHDMIFTILLTRRKRWPSMWQEKIDIISYPNK